MTALVPHKAHSVPDLLYLTPIKIIELLSKHAEFVKANEPGTLKYELTRSDNKETGAVELIMVES